LDSDSDSDDAQDGPGDGSVGADAEGGAAAATAPHTQARYLELEIVCYVTEIYRLHAARHCHDHQWIECATMWGEAYSYILDVVSFLDEYTIVQEVVRSKQTDGLTSVDTPVAERLLREHNLEKLNQIKDSAFVLLNHTAEEMNRADRQVRTTLEKLERKLAPLLAARDATKAILGDEWWTSNPSPKKVEADSRKGMEDEVRALRKCVSIFENVLGVTKKWLM
jgi:hypothetical protein